MKHTWYKCSDHGGCKNPGTCIFCVGGLSSCTVCGAGEGELTTDCPGYKLEVQVKESVYKGRLDFVNGKWVDK